MHIHLVIIERDQTPTNNRTGFSRELLMEDDRRPTPRHGISASGLWQDVLKELRETMLNHIIKPGDLLGRNIFDINYHCFSFSNMSSSLSAVTAMTWSDLLSKKLGSLSERRKTMVTKIMG